MGAGPTERLRVLSVGDRFVPAALLGARLAAHGEPHGLAFDLQEVDLPYPSAAALPLPDDPPSGRIRAFWEDIDGIAARLDDDEADPGAIIDVFDQEPTAGGDELLGLPGTLLTPHIAGASRDTVLRGADLLGAKIVRHLVDGDLHGAANLAAIQPA